MKPCKMISYPLPAAGPEEVPPPACRQPAQNDVGGGTNGGPSDARLLPDCITVAGALWYITGRGSLVSHAGSLLDKAWPLEGWQPRQSVSPRI